MNLVRITRSVLKQTSVPSAFSASSASDSPSCPCKLDKSNILMIINGITNYELGLQSCRPSVNPTEECCLAYTRRPRDT